jgi:SAM-dependent methyltransferase
MGRRPSARARKTLRRILGHSVSRRRVAALYASKAYLDAYSDHTDLRVEQDPREAVGGKWNEVGPLQFDFLVKSGLQPHHRFLDIGCGTLRGGRHFIRYLDAGNYTGIDISAGAIDYSRQLVAEEQLSPKRPRLLVNRPKNLKLQGFAGGSFDYVLAHSVFTHLQPECIEECLACVGRVMRPDARFFFTFYRALAPRQTGLKTFAYPFSFFESLAARNDLALTSCSADYPHPSGQHMAVLSGR